MKPMFVELAAAGRAWSPDIGTPDRCIDSKNAALRYCVGGQAIGPINYINSGRLKVSLVSCQHNDLRSD
jgi:hypothetical protein